MKFTKQSFSARHAMLTGTGFNTSGRAVFNNLYIEKTGETVATDGKILIKVKPPVDDFPEKIDPILISEGDVKNIFPLVKKIGFVDLTLEPDNKITVSNGIINAVIPNLCTPDYPSFPDYMHFFNKPTTGEKTVTLDARRLKKIIDAALEFYPNKEEFPSLTFTITEGMEPVFVDSKEINGYEMNAVIMPLHPSF